MAALIKFRERLFLKYVTVFTAVACLALILFLVIQTWFLYHDQSAAVSRIEREQAVAGAARISEFIKEIETQLSWSTHQAWTSPASNQARLELWRLLLRQVPAITELELLDDTGREQLRVSRLALDAIGSNIDFSKEPKFYEAAAHKSYHSPIYFRNDSEPYMTLAMAGTQRNADVSVAEVNLKFIWDVVSQINVGEHGRAYLIDAQGDLIAHPNISLVLRKINFSRLPQVRDALAHPAASPEPAPVFDANDIDGRRVLTAYAPISPYGWLMFVELPIEEAYGPVYSSIMRSETLLFVAVAVAFLSILFLVRRILRPLEQLEAVASTVSTTKNYKLRVSHNSQDEIGRLAVAFNNMLSELALARDREAADQARSAEQALDLLASASEVASAAVDIRSLESDCLQQISKSGHWQFGQFWYPDQEAGTVKCSAESHFGGPEFANFHQASIDLQLPRGVDIPGLVWQSGKPIWIANLAEHEDFARTQSAQTVGFKTALAFPVVVDNEVTVIFEFYSTDAREPNSIVLDAVAKLGKLLGDILMRKRSESALRAAHTELARVSQLSAMGAMTASIAHEIRQPLTAMVAKASASLRWLEKAPPDLDRARKSLDSIVSDGLRARDVLEAIRAMFKSDTQEIGQVDLNELIREVLGFVDQDIQKQRISIQTELTDNLPQVYGNRTQLQQVILNLLMNAIEAMSSMTDRPRVLRVKLEAHVPDGVFIAVEDTGAGIAPENIERIFNPLFTTKSRGMGMGLSICRSIIEAHHGRLWAEAGVHQGSIFRISLPIG